MATSTKKSEVSQPALVINAREAKMVRSIFETYASGAAGLLRMTRMLEEQRVPTRSMLRKRQRCTGRWWRLCYEPRRRAWTFRQHAYPVSSDAGAKTAVK
jgi:hypothetical protein